MLVAAIQFAPTFQDLEGNRRLMKSLAAEAAEAGAKLIVLPELATCGYSHMSVRAAEPYAEPTKGPTFRTMEGLSSTFNVHIAYGFMERGSESLHNSQALVGPQGLRSHYRKANQWGQDYLWMTPGVDSPPIVSVEGRRVGLLVCRDIRDKSDTLSDLYEPGDADIVAFSCNFGAGAFPSGSWIKFAKANEVYLVTSNRYGLEANNNFGGGGSCIVTPTGQTLCEGLKWSDTCIVYAEV